MTSAFNPKRLDIPSFCASAASLNGQEPLQHYERLRTEAFGDVAPTVAWQAVGSQRAQPGGDPHNWLALRVQASVPMQCQRCLLATDTPLTVDGLFRFVQDEALASEQDELAEEDVLALSREFDLHALVEDELLMALPILARHEVCPEAVKLSVVDPDFEAAQNDKPKPFAALAGVKVRKSV
jgi:uncharacterized protein